MVKTESGALENYDLLGYVVVIAILITIGMMYMINKHVAQKEAMKLQREKWAE